MSSTNKAGMRAGVLGLAVGCGVAVWLAGRIVAGPVGNPPPRPAQPAQPAVAPTSPLAGQLGQLGGQHFGQQFGGLQLGGGQLGGLTVVAPADEELRMRFPFESLADRLEYEAEGLKAWAKEGPPLRTTPATMKRLSMLENPGESKGLPKRTLALIQLHTERVLRFVNSPGFGDGRMGGPPQPAFITLPTPPLTMEELEYPKGPPRPFATERVGDARRPTPDDAADAPGEKRLAGLHEQGLFDFLEPAAFGYVKDREHVAGFESHQFRRMPQLDGPPKPDKADGKERWAVVRLELVSLLKHKGPVAYVTGVLPNMEDGDRAETRPLRPFEEKALMALREGDDLITETSGDHIRMVGSLRAGKQCLECHQVERGDLLGAFSWELQRQPVQEERLP